MRLHRSTTDRQVANCQHGSFQKANPCTGVQLFFLFSSGGGRGTHHLLGPLEASLPWWLSFHFGHVGNVVSYVPLAGQTGDDVDHELQKEEKALQLKDRWGAGGLTGAMCDLPGSALTLHLACVLFVGSAQIWRVA